MPATQVATKLQAEAGSLAAAQAEQQAAKAEVAELTKAIDQLRSQGPYFDRAEDERLEVARGAAHKKWRHCDLVVREKAEKKNSPLTERVAAKIRVKRQRVYDLHPALLARMGESRSLRERRQGLEASIQELESSPEYQRDRREVLKSLSLDDAAREEITLGGQRLARLELDLGRALADLAAAEEVQAKAQVMWESEKLTLENWEEAIRAMGPAAQRALKAIPLPGASDDDPLVGYADLQSGPGQMPHDLHESAKKFGRKEVFG